MFLPLLFSLIPQVFPAHPFITHEEAQYVAYTMMRATESAGPTVEKLGRVFKNPFIANTNITKTVENFVEFLKDRNQNRKVSDDLILRQEQEDLDYFKDRQAILYYRTKQYDIQKFEKVYDEQDQVTFKNWAEKRHAETLTFNADWKRFLNEFIHEVQRNSGSFNFTFKFRDHSDVFRVVEFGKSFYIEEIENHEEDDKRMFF